VIANAVGYCPLSLAKRDGLVEKTYGNRTSIKGITGSLQISLLSLVLTGCIVHAPRYPSTWSPLHAIGKTGCVDVTGTFEDIGETEPGHAPLHLHRILLPSIKQTTIASSVELQLSGASVEAIATQADGTVRNYLLHDDGKCTALERYLKDPNSPGGVSSDGIVGEIHTSLELFRAEDGSLIVRTTERDLVIAMLIPVATDVRYWYRFTQKAPAAP
jgi:hypothetical protein